MLPEAEIAFLDEVFLGSTAILNTQLGLLDERVFRRGATVPATPLRVCVGAANDVPQDPSLAAFPDRFPARVFVDPVADARLEELLEEGDTFTVSGPVQGSPNALAGIDRLAEAARVREPGPVRTVLATTVRRLRAAGDPAWDREPATLAARAPVRAAGRPVGSVAFPAGSGRRRFDALRARADPLVAADLRPPVEPRPARRRTEPLAVNAGPFPGRLPVRNAAALPDGTVLLACGATGTRLLGRDGQERARWDVPATRIVLVDHGSAALPIVDRGVSCDIHRLDPVTRRVRHWAALSAREFADSFDGAHLVTLDRGVITVLDTLAARPRIVRREEATPAWFLGVTRTATSIAALAQTTEGAERVTDPAKWRWDMPGWTLRERSAQDATMPRRVVAATGRLVSVVSEVLLVSGYAHPVVAGGETATLHLGANTTPTANINFPGAASDTIGFREHAGRVTVWDRSGRIVVLEGPMVHAVFRT